MPRVIHFEIHADDPARAMKFYESVFGWEFSQYATQEYWLIKAGDDSEPGINGGLTRRAGKPSSETPSFVCIIGVEKIEESLDRVREHGGRVTAQIRAIPNMGWLAYCKDTEGNLFGLFQQDPSAT